MYLFVGTTCPQPSVPRDGILTLIVNNISLPFGQRGNSYEISCVPGFIRAGNFTGDCTPNGWNNIPVASCEGKKIIFKQDNSDIDISINKLLLLLK